VQRELSFAFIVLSPKSEYNTLLGDSTIIKKILFARYQALPGNADPEALPLFTPGLRERDECGRCLNY